ncbi:MAG: hypothetical protein BJ554DRAFT_3441 [Olpidium bornovanus]|uniref:ADP-ribosylation factor-like protein 2-binding protein n=1 Tax=Olpidium bornovanus TaxID=278681 RepID=A0A8H7ZP49_9FUNG|nr:MAG: hypothetical protein BJ554DRAFT_3441 [Olpidium bornovanus]
MQNTFLKSHCDEFDYEEENKLTYTAIFKEWVSCPWLCFRVDGATSPLHPFLLSVLSRGARVNGRQTQKTENFVEQRLKRALPWFSMTEFAEALRSRPNQVDGDVFDVLATLGDFSAFKELVLSYKRERDGTGINLSGIIVQTTAGRLK